MALILTPLSGIPIIKLGDDLAEIALAGAAHSGLALQGGDILAVAQKVVSVAEGRVVDLATVSPSREAVRLSQRCGKV
jgi:coenzyme F420-0:L-glutamate ligase/coenzyme F420-1:gamma-L-glutamate ligase